MSAPEMPNLIWADTYSGKKDAGYWHDKNDVFNPTKYIRADTVTARLAAAEAMAEALRHAEIRLTSMACVMDTNPAMVTSEEIRAQRNAIRAALEKWEAGK